MENLFVRYMSDKSDIWNNKKVHISIIKKCYAIKLNKNIEQIIPISDQRYSRSGYGN